MHKRYRLCKLCGDMHDLAAWPDNHRDLPPQRSNLSAPAYHSDNLNDLFNPMTCRPYDSKHEYLEATKDAGGIVMGNDEQRDNRQFDTITAQDVAIAAQMVEQGYKPCPEVADKFDMESVIL